MKTKRRRVLGWLCPVLFLMVILLGINSVGAQTIGKIYDKTNCKDIQDLLPPALFRAVEKGEWTIPTAKLDFPLRLPDRFVSASEKNEGKFGINEKGNIIDKATGKFPTYNVYGMPFPKIDPKDPKVAEKIMWNFNFQKYRFKGDHFDTRQMYIARAGYEREIIGLQWFLNFQGRPQDDEVKNNPKNFLTNEMTLAKAPMGLKGTSSMNWEYQDERDNTVFVYVPVIRRVRQMGGAERSAPSYGSDSWQDNAYLWSGKNTMMKWKFVGERTLLIAVPSLKKQVVEENSDGSMPVVTVDSKWGFRTPGWKGAPWVPTSCFYIPRPVWVVEGNHQDPYYNFGKHIMYVDKELYIIWYKEVFDKGGESWKFCPFITSLTESKSGNNLLGWQSMILTIDTKYKHATCVDKLPDRGTGVFLPLSRLGPDYFTIGKLQEISK